MRRRYPRFFVDRRFAGLRVDPFFAALRFAGLRAVRFFAALRLPKVRPALRAVFLVVRFFVERRFATLRAAVLFLRVARFLVVRLAALRFAGLRAAFFLRAGAFFFAGLRAAFFLVAFFLVAFFFAPLLGSGAGRLGPSGEGVGSHGRGSGRGGGGGQVLPGPPPSSPLSPPLGGHVGVIAASPPSASADRAVLKCSREPYEDHVASSSVRAHGRGVSKEENAKRPRRSGVVEHRARLGRPVDQENDWPHPQVRVVFGLLIVKPAPCSPS